MTRPNWFYHIRSGLCALIVWLTLGLAWYAQAHSVSQTVQFASWSSEGSSASDPVSTNDIQQSPGSSFTSITSLQFDLFDEFSLTGTFTSNPMGGDLMAEYFTWDGWIARGSFTLFVEEVNVTVGGGHSQILVWDDGEWGLTADFGRSEFYFNRSIGVSRNQASLTQWQGELSMLANWGYGWDATLNVTLFQYEIHVSDILRDQAEEWLSNRRSFDLVLGEFLLQLISGSVGYDWEWLGYTGVVVDYALTYDEQRFVASRVIWGKELFEPVSLMLSAQFSTRKDRLYSATVSVEF